MKPDDFASRMPELRLEEYFQGKTRAWGLFSDRFGNVRRQFTVGIDGLWDGKELILNEQFSYADGEEETRIWHIEKINNSTYRGRAGDVAGTARGRRAGNALHWQYKLDMDVGDSTWRLAFDDWMFLFPDGVLLNRATVSKWGIDVGTVIIAFMKQDTERESGLTP